MLMLFPNLIRLTTFSFVAYRLRSFLTSMGIAVGTEIGEFYEYERSRNH
ncbi:MAG: hypothetical protein Q7J38_08955 [Gallionella sp.]|nr:hypothetical protein [Gallionella sp.]